MSELFDEVDEDVRRDQLKKLWDQYSIYIIAAALLIIAAVGGWRGYQYLEAKKAAEAGAAFDKAVELSDQNKHAEAEAAFNDLAAKAPSGYRMLARLRAAAEAGNRDPQAAAKMLRRHRGRSQRRRGRAGTGQDPRRRIAAGDRDLSQHADAARGFRRTGGDLPPYRARIAGAVGLARQRYDGGAAVAGSDCQ